jgi:ribonuclease P protein component
MGPSEEKTAETFPKSKRILDRRNFRRVYDGGKKYHAKHFIAFVSRNDTGESRIGITVTRKTGKSVDRNRSRRLVREVFRKNKWRVPAGIDIVINVKRDLAEAGFDELEKDFLTFLERSR